MGNELQVLVSRAGEGALSVGRAELLEKGRLLCSFEPLTEDWLEEFWPDSKLLPRSY